MPRHAGVWKAAWGVCDRCGFSHPIHMLVPQNGLLVCTDGHNCIDDLTIERRPRMIQEILQTDTEHQLERTEVHATLDWGDIQF